MRIEQATALRRADDSSKLLNRLLVDGCEFEHYRQAAKTYIDQGDLDAAIAVYKKSISQFPDSSESYRELGAVQERLKDFKGEIESYQKALKLDVQQPFWLYMTLARLLAEREQVSEAIELYQQGFELYSQETDGLSYARYACLLSTEGNINAALANYKLATERQPDLDWAEFCIGTIRYNQGVNSLLCGKLEAAENYFQEIDQVKSSWEVPVWFNKEEAAWPRFQFDWANKFNALKPKNVLWPKISLVTPSFNQGDFIEETILSVLNQGYENVEYIVIDGGSTDNTLRVLEQYQSQISIVVLEADNGQSNAINKGFRLSTGELFGWLNSDDMLAPGALHQLSLSYLRSNCDVVAGICVTHRDKDVEMIRKPRVRQADFTVEGLADLERWEMGDFFFQPEAFFSREIWEECGGELDEKLHYSMDHDLWMRFAKTGAKLQVIDWPVALFRHHSEQKTADELASRKELSKTIGLNNTSNSSITNPNVSSLDIEKRESNRHFIELKKTMVIDESIKNFSLVDSIETAKTLFSNEDWEGLVSFCNKIVSVYPDSAEVYVWQGIAQEKTGDSSNQLTNYLKAIKLDRYQDSWVYLVAVQRLISVEQWERAFYLLKETLELYPDNEEAYKWNGLCQQNLGDIEGQILSYQRAIALDSGQPEWLYQALYESYCRIGKEENADVILLQKESIYKKGKQRIVKTQIAETLGGESPDTIISLDGSREKEEQPEKEERENICSKYCTYPDLTGQRQLEGGLRLSGKRKSGIAGKQPLVSVITAIYNNQKSFERCVKSVMNQLYDNIEYIVIDGGSDRPTLDAILEHRDSIDYFVSEPDGGIYNAMNKGIELAHGDYVCVLNSDDWYSPEFVSSCVEVALREKSSVVYTYCHHGDEKWTSPGMNAGIFLGHLNINHASFLVSRECYNNIGGYSEKYKIVSDMLWMREAFAAEEKFDLVPNYLFNFSDGGLSSGNDLERRNLMFSEIRSITKEAFNFLNEQEIDDIYVFRFNASKIQSLLSIAKRHKDKIVFLQSLSLYVDYCFRYRDCCRLSHTESSKLFPLFLEAVETFDLSKSAIRINTRYGCFSTLIEAIDSSITKRKNGRGKTVLHYVFNFSTPSETFIYDLLNRLEETVFDNYILFDNRLLEMERPYEKAFHLHWAGFRSEIRNELYKYIFEKLRPDVVIAHFAINEWKLWQRLQSLNLAVPTISMTHGIDVFSMGNNPEYKEYILKNFCKRENAGFTTVSRYLEGELKRYGVPEDKITRIHNTVNDRFFNHRKQDNFFDKNRRLNLLNIGRLIDWKGHIYILEGLKYFKDNCFENVHLTIVYGNGADFHAQIVTKIKELNLEKFVSLISFVDFSTQPSFFQNFDLFIQPSTFSTDGLNKSETFGVAALEAISAGLPVIVSDAGGLPEVIGAENQFAAIVPHANGFAIGKALEKMFEDGRCFSDNIEYARERLSSFSSQKQIFLLCKKIINTCQGKLNATIFSSGTIGGAGYAAFRIHKGLCETAINSKMLTKTRQHATYPGVEVVSHPLKDGNAWNLLQDSSISKEGLTIFTLNHPVITNDLLDTMVKTADVISLHWVARFLSVENICHLSKIGKPVVITIRDMNPLTGGCHYFHGCSKWKENCTNCPQLIDTFDDFPAKVLKAKRDNYNFENITIVTLSQHTAEIVKQVPYFNRCRHETIPNSIETNVFKPSNKIEARKKLGLPLDRQIIGYVPSFSSTVKGYKEIIAAFEIIKSSYADIDPFVMLVGNETPANKAIKLDNKSIGYIAENEKLAIAYSAADVVVVPSLEETFSNTTAEAISCGKPVVGFRTGAIADMVTDGVTGYTFPVGDYQGLAEGIYKVLTGENMFNACRKYSRENLRFMNQAIRYEELFYELYLSKKIRKGSNSYSASSYFPETTPTIMNLLTSKAMA